MTTTLLQPTTKQDRILNLDLLRGFAILGILIMNIQSFSMPGVAYMNPAGYGDLEGINKWVWIISHIFADQKFMTLFSILYGAGIVLVCQRAEAKTGTSASLHYKRTFWLLVIGLIHGHFIWYGDILVTYSLCAFVVYLLRNKSPKTLLIIGLILIAIHSILSLFSGMSMDYMDPAALEANKGSWIQPESVIAKEIAAVTGSLAEQIGHNSNSAFFLETFVFLYQFMWRAGGLMLVGMALYKWGVLSGGKDSGFYKKGFLLSSLIGYPLILFGIMKNFGANWSFEYSMFIGSQYNYWGSLFVSFSYICLISLFAKSGGFSGIKARISVIGQMALTNYIAQSLICTFLFFGWGFGLFGQFERKEQLFVVLAVWTLQFLWSKPWLDRFLFGPLEWMWRSLTYQKRQPFVRNKEIKEAV